MVPTEIKFPAHTDAHVGAKQRPGEQQVTHTHRNALGIQFPPGSLCVYLMVNNATPSEAG